MDMGSIGNQTEIKLILTADGTLQIESMKKGADAVKHYEQATKSSFDAIKGHWFALSAAAVSVGAAVVKAHQLLVEGAKALQAEQAYSAMADNMHINGTRMMAEIDRVTNRTIEDSDMMQQAMKNMTGGMSEENVIKTAEIARMASRRMGEDVKVSWQSISDAVETGRTRQLLAYGLITREQTKMIEAAKAAGHEYDLMKIVMINAAEQSARLGQVKENENEILQQNAVRWQSVWEQAGKWLWYGIQAKGLLENSDPMMNEFMELEKKAIGMTEQQAGAQDRAREAAIKKATQDRKDEEARLKALGVSKDLDKAQLQWSQTIDALNPNLSEEARRIQQITDQAEILKATWSAKGQDTSWIASELERGKQYITQAVELERILKSLSMAAKTAEDSKKAAYELDKVDAGTNLIQLQNRIDAETKLIDLQVKYGEVTTSAAAASRADDELRLLRAKADETMRLIDLNLKYYFEVPEKEAEANKLARDWLELQEKIDAAQQRRLYSYKDIALLEAQQERQLLDIAIQRNEYKRGIYENRWATIMNMGNQVGGELGKGMGQMGASMKGITDVYSKNDAWTKEYERAQQHYNDMRQLYLQGKIDEYQLDGEFNAMKLAQDQAQQQQKLSLVSDGFGMMAGAAQAFYALSGQQSGAAFEAFKAFSIAQTVINTYSAAMGAYNAMAAIPLVGPTLGIAAAAAAIAFGMAKVQSIISMQPGGGASTAAVPSGGGGYSYNQPTVPSYQQPEQKAIAAPSITIHVYGSIMTQDEIARTLVPAITKAIKDGAH